MTVDPLVIDVRDGSDKTFTATLNARDDLSGVRYASASYRSASGKYISFWFNSADRTAGDAMNGTYTSISTVTSLTANGTYNLENLFIQDVVGNYRTYHASDNVAPPTLTVQSNADDVAPVTSSISVAPNPLDVNDGIKAATVDVRVTDDRSGVSYVTGGFVSPSGRQTASFFASPVDGEPGVARGTTMVARYSEAGDWKLSYLCSVDKAGNQECFNNYTTPTLADKFPLALQVISNPADGTAPSMSAFHLTPTAVDVTDGPKEITTSFDVGDNLSGVQYAYVRFASPSTAGASPPVIYRYGFAYAPSMYSYQWNADGTATVTEDDSKRMLTGTVSATTVFPRYDRSGDWQVDEICVVDNVNWTTCYDATSTPPLNDLGETKVVVEWNRTPVVSVTGVSEASYIPGSQPTPGCEVTDVEDGTITDVSPTVTGPDANGTVTVTCSYTDTGGITGTAVKTYQVVASQNTAPSVSVTGVSSDTTYEFGQVPTVGCSITDAEDAGAAATPTVGAITGPLASYGLGSVTVTCSYTDTGGLTGTATATYTITDTTKPTLQVPTSISQWATSNDGATVTYSATATDGVDASPSVSCTPESGSVFPIGTTTVTCTATDEAGNAATGTFTVTVAPSCTASILKQPINADGSSVFKIGSSIPLKIALSNCFGTTPDQVAPQVSLRRLDTAPDGTVKQVLSSGSANEGTTMRYDAAGWQHIYNLSTKRSQFCSPLVTLACSNGDLTAGRYEVTITAPELATPVQGNFDLRQ